MAIEALREKGMGVPHAIKVGDFVTSYSWNGAVVQVEKISILAFSEPIAHFVEGGFWRLSKLILTQAPDTRGGKEKQ